MGKKAGKSNDRRQAAAEFARQQAAEESRAKRFRILGGVVVGAAVVAIIGIAAVAGRDAGPSPAPEPNPAAALPAGVLGPDSSYPYAVPYGTAAEGKPVLEIWEDFQCPACGQVERANGDGIAALGADGQAQVLYRPATFLDATLGNDASVRATAAWGCAIDAGKTIEYHAVVFENQPEREGAGWSNEELVSFGEQAGITGTALDTFTQCVNDGKYAQWAVNSNQAFTESGVTATPTGVLNGKQITSAELADNQLLTALVAEASK